MRSGHRINFVIRQEGMKDKSKIDGLLLFLTTREHTDHLASRRYIYIYLLNAPLPIAKLIIK